MQIKEFDIILDIKKYKKIEEIEVVQGDIDTNVLNITLYDGLNLYSLENLNVEIAFAKADGTTVLQSSQDEESPIIIEGDKIICTLKTNTIASPGKVLAEVRLLEDTRLLTSTRFELYVRKAIVNDETIESTNEFPILNKLINDVGDIIEAVPVIEGKLDEITNTESELNQSISEGNTLKGDLDSSIQEGNILKVGLDNSIAEGNIVKGELDDIIAGTDFEQVLIELNNKSDKTELENLAGEGRTTETVKDNADRISILNTKVSPETPLTTTSQNLSGAVNEVKDELDAHKADMTTQLDTKANKIQEAYKVAVLQNGFTYGSPSLKYYKDNFGTVNISGAVNSGADVSNGVVIFTLPEGYRPVYPVANFAIRTQDGTPIYIGVLSTSGEVKAYGLKTENNLAVNMSFRTVL